MPPGASGALMDKTRSSDLIWHSANGQAKYAFHSRRGVGRNSAIAFVLVRFHFGEFGRDLVLHVSG